MAFPLHRHRDHAGRRKFEVKSNDCSNGNHRRKERIWRVLPGSCVPAWPVCQHNSDRQPDQSCNPKGNVSHHQISPPYTGNDMIIGVAFVIPGEPVAYGADRVGKTNVRHGISRDRQGLAKFEHRIFLYANSLFICGNFFGISPWRERNQQVKRAAQEPGFRESLARRRPRAISRACRKRAIPFEATKLDRRMVEGRDPNIF
jgi:hypothetical protein